MDIKEYFKSFSGKEPVYYCPNPGNGGDSLIACATFQLFDEIELNYRLFNRRDFKAEGKVLFYGGGGNLVSKYKYARNIIEKYHKQAKKMVILPHTIDGNEDLLCQFGSNVDIICREIISYQYVKKNVSKANIFLSQDLAFYLDVKRILSKNASSLAKAIALEFSHILRESYTGGLNIPTPKQLKRFLKREADLHRIFKASENKIVNCFRTDKEKTDYIPEDNIDLSQVCSYGIFNKNIEFLVANQMLRFLDRYTKIRTNRLHIAIAGALSDKEVDFYSNNYYKNEAVFKYSMENKFPKVRWMGAGA